MASQGHNELTHLPLVLHICISESGQHWLVVYSAPSQYLNQCWVIVNWTLGNKLQWDCNQNTKIFIHKNASEYIVCEIAIILSRRKWVNDTSNEDRQTKLVVYSVPSQYLNQCWVIVNWTLGNKLQWDFNQNTKISIHKNASEYIVCEMATILSRRKWVNDTSNEDRQTKLITTVPQAISWVTLGWLQWNLTSFISALFLQNNTSISVGGHLPGLILGLCPANERRRYFVTASLIGWAQA